MADNWALRQGAFMPQIGDAVPLYQARVPDIKEEFPLVGQTLLCRPVDQGRNSPMTAHLLEPTNIRAGGRATLPVWERL